MAEPPAHEIDEGTIYRATIHTDRGTIVMELDPQMAPQSVNNFVSLARRGYYDGLTFHRVVPEFVIQGGDPDGTGRGGPGYHPGDDAGGKKDVTQAFHFTRHHGAFRPHIKPQLLQAE